MSIPINRTTFGTKVLEHLGQPVIKVNVSTSQLDNAIDDAISFFQEFHEVASERTYLAHQMTQNEIDNNRIILPDNITAVLSVSNVNVVGGSTSGESLFNFAYNFFVSNYQSIMQLGNISDFYIAKQYLSQVDDTLNPPMPFRFNSATHILSLDTKLKEKIILNQYMLIQCQAILDMDQYAALWGNRYLRNLAAAYLKRQWGMNLLKFSGVELPSGTKLNGTEIYQQALIEISQAEQAIEGQTEPVGFFSQ